MLRVTTNLSGLSVVGGGVNQMYFGNLPSEAQACQDAVQDFWDALAAQFSNGVSYVLEPAVYELEDETGDLISIVPVTAEPAKAGIPTGQAIARASQGLIRWQTDGAVNNRLVRGRTFVPGMLEDNNFAPGVPGGNFLTVGLAAATALVDDLTANLVIWSRPFEGSETVSPRVGTRHGVVSASIWNEWAVLRSRRD